MKCILCFESVGLVPEPKLLVNVKYAVIQSTVLFVPGAILF